VGGARPGPSQKVGRLFGPLHRWNGHNHSLVPNTGGAGTAVLWLPAWGERGLEEEHCIAAGERRGRGQRRKEKKRREEKKKREKKSVAWRRSVALLQVRKEEEEDRGHKRRREEKRREERS